MALRELFDQVAQGVEENANLMAARIVQLGGMAEGTAQAVARRTALDAYRLAAADGNGHTYALSTAPTAFGRHGPQAHHHTDERNDTQAAPLRTQLCHS